MLSLPQSPVSVPIRFCVAVFVGTWNYAVVGETSPALTMSAVSRDFQSHCSLYSEKSAISLQLRFAKPTVGSLLIFRARTSVRPNHLFDHNLDTSNSPWKGSGMPNHYGGDLLHTMGMYGLSRVRTELLHFVVVPSLAATSSTAARARLARGALAAAPPTLLSAYPARRFVGSPGDSHNL